MHPLASVCIETWDMNKIPGERPGGGGLCPDVAHVPPVPPPAPRPIPIVQGPPTLARAVSPSTSATFQRTGTDWKVESSSRSQAAASRQNSPKSVAGGGARLGSAPLIGTLVIGFMSRHSAFRRRGGGGAQARRGVA